MRTKKHSLVHGRLAHCFAVCINKWVESERQAFKIHEIVSGDNFYCVEPLIRVACRGTPLKLAAPNRDRTLNSIDKVPQRYQTFQDVMRTNTDRGVGTFGCCLELSPILRKRLAALLLQDVSVELYK